WSIGFGSDSVRVTGSIAGAAADVDIGYWKIGFDGNILSQTTYSTSLDDWTFGLAVDTATGRAYVAGAVQYASAGQPDPHDPNVAGNNFEQALWIFDANSQLVGAPKKYRRGGGFDAATDAVLDGSGNVWAVGGSSSAGKIDLALWKYDSNGNLTSGYPKVSTGAFQVALPVPAMDFSKISSKLWVTAMVKNDFGNLDLMLSRYDLNGAQELVKYWHGAQSTDDKPYELAAGDNQVAVLGTVGTSQNQIALWKYDTSGNLQTVQAVGGKTYMPAEHWELGVALTSVDTWLAVWDSTAALRFTEGATISGVEGLEGAASTAPVITGKIWTGSVSSSAANASNWQGGQVPTFGDVVRFDATAGAKSCFWDLQNTFISTLTLAGGFTGSVTLGEDLFMSGDLRQEPGTSLNVSNRSVGVGGNFIWTGGNFNASGSTVIFAGSAPQTYSASSVLAFNDLAVANNSITFLSGLRANNFLVAAAGANLFFNAGSTLTVSNNIFTGSPGAASKTRLRSTQDGSRWFLNFDGSGIQGIYNTDVKDSYASGARMNALSDGSNVDSGNNVNWDFGVGGGTGAVSGLEILLPGEYYLIGLGKSGIPISQTLGLPFAVTVKAVDSSSNVVAGASTVIGWGASDPAAFLPSYNSLQFGTRIEFITLQSTGIHTLTVSAPFDVLIPGARSSTFTVSVQDIQVYVSSANLAPSAIDQGANRGFLKLGLWTSTGYASWIGLGLSLTGTQTPGDVLGAKIHGDADFNGQFDPNVDFALTDETFFSGDVTTATFFSSGFDATAATGQLIGPATRYFFIALHVANAATVGNTLGLKISTPDNFLLAGGNMASQNIYPVESALATIRSFGGGAGDNEAPQFFPNTFLFTDSQFNYLVAGSTTDTTEPGVSVALRDTGSGLRNSSSELTPFSQTLALWHMKEGAGSISQDSSGRGVQLNLINNPSWSVSQFGFGQALSFGSNNPYAVSAAKLPLRASATGQAFTVEMWFLTDQGKGVLFQLADSSSPGKAAQFDSAVGWNTFGELQFTVTTSSNVRQYAKSSIGFQDNLWHYLVASLGSDGMKLYVDGQLAGENAQATSSNALLYSSNPFVFLGAANRIDGTNFNDQYFASNFASSGFIPRSIDEVRISSQVLSADEIASNFRGTALKFSRDGGASWKYRVHEMYSTGFTGTTEVSTITAYRLPLAPGTANRVAFLARDVAGNLGVSPEFQIPVKVLVDTTAPAAVGLTAAPGNLAGEVKLSWNSPGDDGFLRNFSGRYLIHYAPGTGVIGSTASAQVFISTSNASPNMPETRTLAGLTPGSTYTFTLWSQDLSGNFSNPSIAAARSPDANVALAASKLVVVAPGEVFVSGAGKSGLPANQSVGTPFKVTVYA
ncbi:MAG: hypothetical protein HY611_03355, partial [Elusimicrobia bacterium]|nr:hypothetical protein [Elusimicrobiota bacterium]